MLKLLMIFAGLLTFGLFAWFAYFIQGEKKAARRNLSNLKCPKCGNVFGEGKALESEQSYLKEMSDLMKSNPGTRYSVVQIWPVNCSCGWEGKYEPAKNELLSGNVVVS
jgi:hypothetical protein